MNLLTRLSELVSVNLHSLLDQAENPERMPQYQSAEGLCSKVKAALGTLQHRLTEASLMSPNRF